MPKHKMSKALHDRIRGMHERGEDSRSIAASLEKEGIVLAHTTIWRFLQKPVDEPLIRGGTTSKPARKTSSHNTTPSESPVDDIVVTVSDDPRVLERGDWMFYETSKEKLRIQAETERAKGNIRGYQALLKLAEAAEKRARQLRPPVPPDPNKDPTYLSAARDLTSYLEHLVKKAEQGEPIPARTIPPVEPIAA